MKDHEFFIRRCFQLALKGKSNVAPNPMVGAVVVYNGEIIGEGYHQKYGEAHAEVNAINSVENQELLNKATIYVSLEPCSHHGKTPPCSDLIIEKKIPNVVISCVDSFSKVAGKGIEKLKSAGCNVVVGVLKEEGRALNRRFFTFHEKKRPYIILKWAQSADGFMDVHREKNQKGSIAISSITSRQLVHQWRNEEMGILVGSNTVIIDNPSLTTRLVKGKNPVRIIIDPYLESIHDSNEVFSDEARTIYYHIKELGKEISGVEFVKLDEFTMNNVFKDLYHKGIQSILVEGGCFTHNQLLKESLWDEIRVFHSKKYIKNGLLAPELKYSVSQEVEVGDDVLKVYWS